MYVGIDVGARVCHVVALGEDGGLCGVGLFDVGGLESLVEWASSAVSVAVDAPAQISTVPHELDEGLSVKFRRARCAEVSLGREYGIWVPWVAPSERPEEGWIAVGLSVFDALGRARLRAIEVYPHAGFCALGNVRRLPKKGSADGARRRVGLLAEAGISEPNLEMWSHDGLDALVAAVIARDHHRGCARRVSCGHDDSAIWLPARGA